MNRSQVFSVPPATYDGFLFAQVCEEANGMHLSVLSALARLNIDPWQEAMRLATMPEAVAVEAMKSVLRLISGKTWHGSEVAATAERLINLLPRGDPPALAGTAKAPIHVNSNWLVWARLAVAVTLLTTHQQAASDAGKSTSQTTIVTSRNGAAPMANPVVDSLSKPKGDAPSVPMSR